jgi:hypothetical protein
MDKKTLAFSGGSRDSILRVHRSPRFRGKTATLFGRPHPRGLLSSRFFQPYLISLSGHHFFNLRLIPLARQSFYSLRPIILFPNIDVSRHILVIDTSILVKINMCRREYLFSPILDPPARWRVSPHRQLLLHLHLHRRLRTYLRELARPRPPSP